MSSGPAVVPPPYDLGAMPSAAPAVESPTPYHRLFRTAPRYAGWRPLVAVLIFLAFLGVAEFAIGIVWIIVAFATGDVELTSLTDQDALLALLTDTSNPLSLAYLLASVAVMLPLPGLAMLCVGLRPIGLRHSVAFRLRWRWLLRTAIPALVVTVVNTGLSFLPILFGDPIEPVPVEPGSLILSIVLVVLLVPLQSAAEEYVFRGLIMQTIGAWVRNVWVAIAVSTVIFTIGHTQYEIWGMLSVAVMGAGFAIVTWRTGGLEAGIAMHVVNNLLAFGALASGALGTTQISSEGSGPLAPVIQAVFTAVWVLWIEFAARRRGLVRAREAVSA